MVDLLKRRGIFDDALVVFVGDHGEEFQDHGTVGHGPALYDETLRVPLLIKWPQSQPAAASTQPISQVDVAPTILDYLGLPAATRASGRSWLGDARERPRYAETYWGGAKRAVVYRNHKLIRRLQTAAEQVYGLARDPAERDDLAGSVDEKTREKLTAAMEDFPEPRADESFPSPRSRDAEETERLRSLGYIE